MERSDGFTYRMLSGLGAFLISFLGITHLLEVEEHFEYEIYLGLLFLGVLLACALAGGGLFRSGSRWAWLLGDAVCAAALAGFLASRTVGLPAFPEGVGEWWDFQGWVAVLLELGFLSVSLLALTSPGQRIVREEERRLRREEELSPDNLEREMSDLRGRMAPGLRDLRSRAEPSRLRDRALQDARRRLRALVRRR